MLQTGESHQDRNAQFEYINKKCGEFIQQGQPVISVDIRVIRDDNGIITGVEIIAIWCITYDDNEKLPDG